jgi:hypothetical protein
MVMWLTIFGLLYINSMAKLAKISAFMMELLDSCDAWVRAGKGASPIPSVERGTLLLV